jgi:hypothetical protein
MFESINNQSFKEWFKKLQEKIAEEMADSPEDRNTGRCRRSILEQAGYDKLQEVDHMIGMAEMVMTVITHHKSALLRTREKLQAEILEQFGENPDPEASEQPETQPEDQQEDDSLQIDKPRLARLEKGLSDAITVLSGTKMASYFKAIKQLVEDLTVVANADEMPEDQRAESIEAVLQDAVKVLSESACAARSKVTIDLREHLIELLEKVQA